MAPTQSKLITRQDAAAATHNHFMTFTAGILSGLRGVKDTPHGDVFAAYDFINLCNKKPIGDAYGGVTYDRIVKANASKFSPCYFKFKGKSTPCLTLAGLQRLLCEMPGEFAEKYVDENNELRSRYEAGDESLIPEIQANNESDAPINVAFRRSEEHKRLTGNKRTIEEQQTEEFDSASDESQDGMMLVKVNQFLQNQQEDRVILHQLVNKFTEFKAEIKAELKAEMEAKHEQEIERYKQKLIDQSAMYEMQLDRERGRETCIRDVLKCVKKNWKYNKDELMAIGEIVKRKYFEENGEAPLKVSKTYPTGTFSVCVYYWKDRKLIKEAIREYFQLHP